jgi:pantoate kinase
LFFEPYYNQDLSKSGSCGAGINLKLGAFSEVFIQESNRQNFEVFINNKKSNAPVTKLALKLLTGDNKLNILVKTRLLLPMGQGFGMSAAGALSSTLALSELTNISNNEAIKAAHFAEVQLRTGLGDVIASCFGGIEIRKSAGLPPWGLIEHILDRCELVLCVIGKKMDTKKILTDQNKIKKINEYGNFCTKKILEKPSLDNLFLLSQIFTKKTGLASQQVLEAIGHANKFGMASMCMLGNSVFATGKTNELVKVLSNFGKVFVCEVDEIGARII